MTTPPRSYGYAPSSYAPSVSHHTPSLHVQALLARYASPSKAAPSSSHSSHALASYSPSYVPLSTAGSYPPASSVSASSRPSLASLDAAAARARYESPQRASSSFHSAMNSSATDSSPGAVAAARWAAAPASSLSGTRSTPTASDSLVSPTASAFARFNSGSSTRGPRSLSHSDSAPHFSDPRPSSSALYASTGSYDSHAHTYSSLRYSVPYHSSATTTAVPYHTSPSSVSLATAASQARTAAANAHAAVENAALLRAEQRYYGTSNVPSASTISPHYTPSASAYSSFSPAAHGLTPSSWTAPSAGTPAASLRSSALPTPASSPAHTQSMVSLSSPSSLRPYRSTSSSGGALATSTATAAALHDEGEAIMRKYRLAQTIATLSVTSSSTTMTHAGSHAQGLATPALESALGDSTRSPASAAPFSSSFATGHSPFGTPFLRGPYTSPAQPRASAASYSNVSSPPGPFTRSAFAESFVRSTPQFGADVTRDREREEREERLRLANERIAALLSHAQQPHSILQPQRWAQVRSPEDAPRTPPSSQPRALASTRKTGSEGKYTEQARRDRERMEAQEEAEAGALEGLDSEGDLDGVARELDASFRSVQNEHEDSRDAQEEQERDDDVHVTDGDEDEAAEEAREDAALAASMLRHKPASKMMLTPTPSPPLSAQKNSLAAMKLPNALGQLHFQGPLAEGSSPSASASSLHPAYTSSSHLSWSTLQRNREHDAARAAYIASLAASTEDPPEMNEGEFELGKPWAEDLEAALEAAGEDEEEEEEEEEEEQAHSRTRHAARQSTHSNGMTHATDVLTPAQRIQLASLQQSFEASSSPVADPADGDEDGEWTAPAADGYSATVVPDRDAPQSNGAVENHARERVAHLLHHLQPPSSFSSLPLPPHPHSSVDLGADGAHLGPWSVQTSQQPSLQPSANSSPFLRAFNSASASASASATTRQSQGLKRTDPSEDEARWSALKAMRPSRSEDSSSAASSDLDDNDDGEDDGGSGEDDGTDASLGGGGDHVSLGRFSSANGTAGSSVVPSLSEMGGPSPFPSPLPLPDEDEAEADDGAHDHDHDSEAERSYGHSQGTEREHLRLASPEKAHSLLQPHPQPLYMGARVPGSNRSSRRSSTASGAGRSPPIAAAVAATAAPVAAPASSRPSTNLFLPHSLLQQSADRDSASHVQSILDSYARACDAVQQALAGSLGAEEQQLDEAQEDKSDAQELQKQQDDESFRPVLRHFHRLFNLSPLHVSLWEAQEQPSEASPPRNDAFQAELDRSLDLFARAPPKWFHPARLQRFSSLLLRALAEEEEQEAGQGSDSTAAAAAGVAELLKPVLDAQTSQAIRAAVQGVVGCMRGDWKGSRGDDNAAAEGDEEAPLSPQERADLERMDMASFLSFCPLSLRLALSRELLALLRDELAHARIVSQLLASYSSELSLLARTHAAHCRRLTEEILGEVGSLLQDKARNVAELGRERRRRLDAIAAAAQGSYSTESPPLRGRKMQATEEDTLALVRSGSKEEHAFPVHRVSSDAGEEEEEQGDFEPSSLEQQQQQQAQQQQEQPQEADANDAAAPAASAGDADAEARRPSSVSGGAVNESTVAPSETVGSGDVDEAGFATVVIRDESGAAERFDAGAEEEEEEEEEDDEEEEEQEQEHGRPQRHDHERGFDQAHASANSSSPGSNAPPAAGRTPFAPVGQLRGDDAEESSSEEEEEEDEEANSEEPHAHGSDDDAAQLQQEQEGVGRDDGDVGAIRGATEHASVMDSVIERIMRHHTDALRSGSGAADLLLPSFSRHTAAGATAAPAPSPSVLAAREREFAMMRDLLSTNMDASLASLRAKASARLAAAQAEMEELQRGEVQLADLIGASAAAELAMGRFEMPGALLQRDGAAPEDESEAEAEREEEEEEEEEERKYKMADESDEEQQMLREAQGRDSDVSDVSDLEEEEGEEQQQRGGQAERDTAGDSDEFDYDEHGEARPPAHSRLNQPDEMDFSDLNGLDVPAVAHATLSPSRANAYAPRSAARADDSHATATGGGVPSAAAARHGLMMALRERVDAAAQPQQHSPSGSDRGANALSNGTESSGTGTEPTLASFTAGASTLFSSADRDDSGSGSSSLFFGSSEALSFLRVAPSRARALQDQFAREQRSFDERHEPTAVPDARMPTIPPAVGRDELDPSSFLS